MTFRLSLLFSLFISIISLSGARQECASHKECDAWWPEAVCSNGRCRCPQNFIRRSSKSRGWVCLSLQDAATGQLGPPISCPLPSGAGYRMILRDSNSSVIFCHTKNNSEICGEEYECIRTIGVLNAEHDGVCCPQQESSCDLEIDLDQGGWLTRWHFNGEECIKFMWNPETTKTANIYLTKQHCQSYCQ